MYNFFKKKKKKKSYVSIKVTERDKKLQRPVDYLYNQWLISVCL